jgi:hypothetical protein
MEKESKPNTSSNILPNNVSLLDLGSGLKAGEECVWTQLDLPLV